MNLKLIFKLTITVFITNITFIRCEDLDTNKLKEDYEIYKHLKMHTATSALSQIGLFASTILGIKAAEYSLKKNVPTWIGRKLGETPEGFLCENTNIIAASTLLAAIAGYIPGLYLMYKTPQWTDEFLLKNNLHRTTKQKIITFLNRYIIPWPFGVWLGEYFALKKNKIILHDNK